MVKEKNKINFFKRWYYSVFKIQKYEELSCDGLKDSIKYILCWLLILAIMYASIIIIQSQSNINNLKNYLTENLPEMVCEENVLTVDKEERTVLDNQYVIANFGGSIIIDTITEYESLINEYKEKGQPFILLTKDYFTTINAYGAVEEQPYDKIIEKYINKDIKKIDKEELLYLFDNFSYTQYFLVYAISYVIAHALMIFMYCLFLTIIAFIICKVKKITIKVSQIYSMGLYSMTLTALGYFISNVVTFNISNIIRMTSVLIAAIYLGRAIYVNKWIR